MALSDSHGYTNITTIHLKNFFHLPKVKSVTNSNSPFSPLHKV